jgi:hypothetical protein
MRMGGGNKPGTGEGREGCRRETEDGAEEGGGTLPGAGLPRMGAMRGDRRLAWGG